MVKHIVMWKLKESPDGVDKAEWRKEVKERLETLPLLVPGVLQFEVGCPFGPSSDASADVVLVTAFKDWAALAQYDTHPEHEKVKAFIRERVRERRVADFEI
jgi:ABC-type antimicrobial peptide transport system ATPase subunit